MSFLTRSRPQDPQKKTHFLFLTIIFLKKKKEMKNMTKMLIFFVIFVDSQVFNNKNVYLFFFFECRQIISWIFNRKPGKTVVYNCGLFF
jgi:hypothetical protein